MLSLDSFSASHKCHYKFPMFWIILGGNSNWILNKTKFKNMIFQDWTKVSRAFKGGHKKGREWWGGGPSCSRRINGSPISSLHQNSNNVSRLHSKTQSSNASEYPRSMEFICVCNWRGRGVWLPELIIYGSSPCPGSGSWRWSKRVEHVFKGVEICADWRAAAEWTSGSVWAFCDEHPGWNR